jgi:hypothetical protein
MVRFKSHPLSNVLLMNIHLLSSNVMTSLTNAFNNATKPKDLGAHLLWHNNQYNNTKLATSLEMYQHHYTNT